MSHRLQLLLVEDNEDDVELMRLALRDLDCEVTVVDRAERAKAMLADREFEIVLADLGLPDSHGLDTFRMLHAAAERVAFVVLTGLDDQELGLRTVQEGAQDYLVKGRVHPAEVAKAIRFAIERKRMAEKTVAYAHALAQANAEMKRALVMARQAQRALLPTEYPTFPRSAAPKNSRIRFYHRYEPTDLVGGDLFRVVAKSDHEAGVLICDAMGHGVSAALVTAILRGLTTSLAEEPPDPGRVINALNERLVAIFAQGKMEMFVSALYVVLDVRQQVLRYCNAGHPAGFQLRSDGSIVRLHPGRGRSQIAMGMTANPGYISYEHRCEPGDRVLLVTDGVYEVENAAGQHFDDVRLEALLTASRALPPAALIDGVLMELHQFAGEQPFSDDICLLLMSWDEPAAPPQ